MSGAEAGVLLIMFLWAVVIVCFIVGSLADRKRRRAVQARLDRQAAEAAARRRSQAPYQWPKHRGPRQEFSPLPTAAFALDPEAAQPITSLPAHIQPARSRREEEAMYGPQVIVPAVMTWDATPSSSCDSSSVSVSCD